MPPECSTCVAEPAGTHLVPLSRTPRDGAPQLDEVMQILREVLPPGIRPIGAAVLIQDCSAKCQRLTRRDE